LTSFVQEALAVHPQRVGWASRLGVFMAGACHALALSPMVAAWGSWCPALLQSLALSGLLWVLAPFRTPRQVAGLTWLYGTVWLLGATGWMYVSLHTYGGLPFWLAGAAVGLLCMALSAYMALLGWVWARWRMGVWWRDALAWAGLWLVVEWARAIVLTGFPWGASGYGLVDSPLVVLAPWVGVYGMGAIWACLLALAVWSWRREEALAVRGMGLGLASLAVLGCGVLRQFPAAVDFTRPHGGPLSVSLLQGNVPQDEKFREDRQVPMLIWHGQNLLASRSDLVIAPETAIPLLPSQLPPDYWAQVQAGFGESTGRAALIGIPLGDFQRGYTNSVVGVGPGHPAPDPESPRAYQYSKHHLVPFGEFIPWGFHWFVRMMNMPLGDFRRGPLVAPSFDVKGQRVAPTICYEDLFGEEIAARFSEAGRAPTILANVSNLAWFGESVAIHQHLQIARMRSLEFQLPTLRATNTGATVLIDHQGRVAASLVPNTRDVLHTVVQGREGVTPFAWWAGRWGLWPALLAGLLCAVLAAGSRKARPAH
jgi:apolipoprotein N-acyltransferase